MCEIKQLKPNHVNIKINGQKPQDKKTTINAIMEIILGSKHVGAILNVLM